MILSPHSVQVVFDMRPRRSDSMEHTAPAGRATSEQSNDGQPSSQAALHCREGSNVAAASAHGAAAMQGIDALAQASSPCLVTAESSSISAVVDALQHHAVVALPTDTLYGGEQA